MKLRNKKIIGENISPIFFNQNVRKKSVDVFKEFASESTVHGIPFIASSKAIYKKLFWLTMVTIALGGAVKLALTFYKSHEAANMQTTVVDSELTKISVELPAVTLCHPNLISKHRVVKFLDKYKNMTFPPGLTVEDFEKSLPFLSELLLLKKEIKIELKNLELIINYNNITITELFSELSPQCDEMMLLCLLGNEIKPCGKLFQRSFTQEGPCCSFNYHPNKNPEVLNEEKLQIGTYGIVFFISVLIKPYPIDDKIISTSLSDYMKLIIHESYTYPSLSTQEVPVTLANEYVGMVHGTKLCTGSEVKDLPISKRKCYLSNSKSFYRSANYYIELQEGLSNDYCKCVPFYTLNVKNYTICNVSDSTCLYKFEKEIHNISFGNKEFDLMPDCEGITFKISGSTLPLDAAQFNPSLIYETAVKYPGSTIIRIAYVTESYTVERRELVLSWINLVSSLGGVFSLCLGCSFISLLEIFNFIIKFILKIFGFRTKL